MSLKPKTLEEVIDFIFHTYDIDNKGKLSAEEAQQFFSELFSYFQCRVDPRQLDLLFRKVDLDRDGFLSRNELLRVIKNKSYYLL